MQVILAKYHAEIRLNLGGLFLCVYDTKFKGLVNETRLTIENCSKIKNFVDKIKILPKFDFKYNKIPNSELSNFGTIKLHKEVIPHSICIV